MYTATQSFELRCVTGETGDNYTASATASSIISQADAEAKAIGMAKALAYEFIQCSFADDPSVTIYYSAEVSASVDNDAGYQTAAFSVTLPAGALYSTESQEAVDAAAQIAANVAAEEKKNAEQLPIFYNAEQVWTGACPGGTGDGYTVTITVPAGTVTSNVSTSDASQVALDSAKAQVDALLDINCTTTYFNTPQSYTANCESPLVGSAVTITIPARAYSSLVSQEAVDATALATATAAATAALVCAAGYWNVEQSYTATCAGIYGPTWKGDDSSATVPAGTTYSTVSQANADGAALGEATAQAIAGLSCSRWGF